MSNIDSFFDKLYTPLNNNVSLFDRWLDGLKESTFIYNVCRYIGKKVPKTCYFKRKFKLNFTPCKINPFYQYLIALSVWNSLKEDLEYVSLLMTNDSTVYAKISKESFNNLRRLLNMK